MQYQEFLPSPFFSKFIECFWKLQCTPEELHHKYDVLAPDCTFDLIFANTPFGLHFLNGNKAIQIKPGVSLIGQKTSCVYLNLFANHQLFGIRFKPFALVNLLPISMAEITDKVLPLSKSFFVTPEQCYLIQQVLKSPSFPLQVQIAEKLILQLWGDQLCIDETFRAQLNFILNRKGIVKIKDLFDEFGISKVTLNNHFSHKMGLSPKKVSRIWRINYFLQLQKQVQHHSLTQLGLEAGFYDQAHFIKEFKAFFKYSPSNFFQEHLCLLDISQQIITRRFSNQYDPRT